MSRIEEKYLNMISPGLERFRVIQRNPYKANFRCPYCGDSKKSKTKARGNVYEKCGRLNYKCFNCGIGKSAINLIKDVNPLIFKEMMFERYRDKDEEKDVESLFKQVSDNVPKGLLDEMMPRVTDLPKDHVARVYVEDRMIPLEKMKEIYYVDDMQKVEDLSPKYKNKIVGTEDRLCIPFYGRKGRIVGFTFRALDDHPIKYLDIKLNDNEKLIYNIDKVNLTKDVTVVEGPIDSMFLPNCVAAGSGDLKHVNTHVPKDKMILVYDNQPRNREIVKIMGRSVVDGYRHFIWPRNIRSGDINDLIMNKEYNIEELPDLINKNTYGGLELLTRFNAWKRCN